MWMNKEKVKRIIYSLFVDSDPVVSIKFKKYLEKENSDAKYAKKMLALMKIIARTVILREREMDVPLKKLSMPESNQSFRKSPDELVIELEKYDVISFDVFDTLILRRVQKPTDVFRILELENSIMGFAEKRIEVEKELRSRKYEITLDDIYEELEKKLGISKERYKEKEIEIEKKICFANPYFIPVVKKLNELGKKLIVTSDMYLAEEVIKEILKKAGYDGISSVFISNVYNKKKNDGSFQRYITGLFDGEKIVHIGDDWQSDIDKSRSVGWDAIYYANVAHYGNGYRRNFDNSIDISIYNSLVNTKMHATSNEYSPLYELGYIYGGLLAKGYVDYLNDLVTKERIDKLLFVARDGYILNQIEKKYHPEISCEYIPFSRIAAYKMTIEKSVDEYLNYIIKPLLKVNQTIRVKDLLIKADLECLTTFVEESGINLNQIFTEEVYIKLKKIAIQSEKLISAEFEKYEKAAQKYFKEVIGESRKICIVDIGWMGSGILNLKYFLEKKCNMNCTVIGALFAANDNESTNLHVSGRDIMTYAFSNQDNVDLQKLHYGNRNEREYRDALFEIFFTENKPSFLHFKENENKEIVLVYGNGERNNKIIIPIQKGMMDFVDDMGKVEEKIGKVHFSGRNAYKLFDSIARNKEYIKKTLGRYNVSQSTIKMDVDTTRKLYELM